ncbi:MAG TPA: bifunctional riboflavin kinase/FAD synthetase, partial [Xanthobacteraceae bacterium]|nr:bifunctional riboflavin kinase/FAD synthetase [Xanthobacteraceae bacterium]
MTDPANPPKPFIVAHDDGEDSRLRGAVLAIGNFDGVHRGHRTVVTAAIDQARTLGRPAAALTFEPHPRRFLRPAEPLFRLTNETTKLRLLAGTGLDGARIMTFNAALASLSAEEFIRRVLVDRFAISGATIGFDFHFGKDRRGSPEFLAAEGQ